MAPIKRTPGQQTLPFASNTKATEGAEEGGSASAKKSQASIMSFFNKKPGRASAGGGSKDSGKSDDAKASSSDAAASGSSSSSSTTTNSNKKGDGESVTEKKKEGEKKAESPVKLVEEKKKETVVVEKEKENKKEEESSPAAGKAERRSKKAEDKNVAAAAPTPAPTPAVAAPVSAPDPVVTEAACIKPRKRLRKVVEDSDDDDDLLSASSKPTAITTATTEKEKEKEKETDATKKSKTDSPAAAASAAAAPMEVVVEKEKEKPKKKVIEAMEEDEEEEEEEAEEDEEEEEDEEDDDDEAESGAEEEGEGGDAAADGGASSSRTISSALMSSSTTTKGKTKSKSKSKSKSKPKAKASATSTKEIIAEIRALSPGYPSMTYRTFTDVLAAIEKVSGRLEITDIVRELLVKTIECCPSDLPILLYLLCGKIAPAYEGIEMGIGDKNLIDALKSGLGCSAAQLNPKSTDDYEGDLGAAAQKFRAGQRTLNFGHVPKALSCKEVLGAFREIAACSGGKSMKSKTDIIKRMLVRCGKEGSEVKFLVRGLQTKLRCRLAEPTVLTALAQAFVMVPTLVGGGEGEKMEVVVEEGDKKESGSSDSAKEQEGGDKGEALTHDDTASAVLAAEIALLHNPSTPKQAKWDAAEIILKQAYSECPNYDRLTSSLLSAPLTSILHSCRLQPGVPVKPMLAKPQDSFQEVLKRMQGLHFTMEYKYDGERAQVHLLPDGAIKIFSRNSEDTTGKYPDLVQVLPQAIQPGTTSFVIDAEAVAIDLQTNKLLPFQILSTRKRKAENIEDIKVQVILYAFDILYLNDKPVLQEPLLQRRTLLREAFKPVEGKFEFAISLDHHEDGDTSPIEAFLDEAVTGNCEGLMVKTLEENATYEPTKRSLNWLKLKKDYLSGADGQGKGPADSLDLVVIGANRGQGKRSGWYGAFLLACYDPEAEEYQSVCKLGTGFSEEFLAAVKPQLDTIIVEHKPRYYNTSLECDVWFEPKKTWEVKAADLSKSTAHKGALDRVEKGKGIALRFPRFIRERADKNPEDATTAEQVAEAYQSQALVESITAASGGKKGKGKKGEEDEDDWCI